MHSTPRFLIIGTFAAAFMLVSGCAEKVGDRPGTELARCEYTSEERSWRYVDRSDVSYEERVAPYIGTHEARIADQDLQFILEPSDTLPAYHTHTDGGCPDYTTLPLVVTLNELDDASEALSTVWTREINIEMFDDGALNGARYFDDFNALETLAALPEIEDNERIHAAVANLFLRPEDGIELKFVVGIEGVHGSGDDGSVSEHQAPWFSIHVPHDALAHD